MVVILSIALFLAIADSLWQRSRARSAEKIMNEQHEIIKCQNLLIKKQNK